MNPILKNIIAVVAGIIIGSIVNMGIVMISSHVIPAPEGADISTMEGLRDTMHLFEPRHFIFPFLAHAIGTLIGALIAAAIAATHKMKFAMAIGIFFLIGGIYMTIQLPSSPTWFIMLDLIGAYIPMAYIGGRLVTRKK